MSVTIGRDLAGRPSIVRVDRKSRSARGLTRADLMSAINDEHRLGSVGYSCRFDFPKRLQTKGDTIVLREANRQGWTYADLVFWVDSKYGRWFWDSLYGCTDEAGAAGCVTLDWAAEDTTYWYDRRSMADDIAGISRY